MKKYLTIPLKATVLGVTIFAGIINFCVTYLVLLIGSFIVGRFAVEFLLGLVRLAFRGSA